MGVGAAKREEVQELQWAARVQQGASPAQITQGTSDPLSKWKLLLMGLVGSPLSRGLRQNFIGLTKLYSA